MSAAVSYLLRLNLSNTVAYAPASDTTNTSNPIPFCDTPTTFDKPTITLPQFPNPPPSYLTINHLPSLLPRGG